MARHCLAGEGFAQGRGDIWRGGDGDLDGLVYVAGLDGGAEGVFQELGDDVLHVHGDMGELGFLAAAGEDQGRPLAVAEVAYLADEAFA